MSVLSDKITKFANILPAGKCGHIKKRFCFILITETSTISLKHRVKMKVRSFFNYDIPDTHYIRYHSKGATFS